MKIGVIGGSGLYELPGLSNAEEIMVDTPFGSVTLLRGLKGDKEVFFLSRHQKGHKVPPHVINYRANIYALFKLGVNYVISTNAVGSVREYIEPGYIVIPDQIIDLTKNRVYTFFDGDFEVEFPDGRKKSGVIHTDVSEPYCNLLRSKIKDAAEKLGLKYIYGGTYVCMEGPRFETPAEIKFIQLIGGDIVGMTSSPEVFLAKELELCYASISVVTNLAAGMQKKITHEEVIELFNEMLGKLVELISHIIDML